MPNAKIFSKFDATSGYWQLKLTEASSKVTCFNSPWGRFVFKRLPFGISSASEIWQRAMDEEFSAVEGLDVIVDDMLLSAESVELHDDRLELLFDRIRESGLKLNRPKCEVSSDSVGYSGHLMTGQGLKADPERIRALQDMHQPK